MSTTPLTDAINALTTYSNTVTGASDTTLSDAVATLAAGYGGGGSIGGLANMADVASTDNAFAYMLTCFKNGATQGGTFTLASALPNTESLLLDTGLTTFHGVLMTTTTSDQVSDNVWTQTNKTIFIFLRSDSTLDVISQYTINAGRSFGYTQGDSAASAPIQGALRLDGGKIYYTARYNGNNNYQIIRSGVQYDWIAW